MDDTKMVNTSVNDPILNKELRRDEGVKYSPYRDSVGILTVGVGHNIEAKPLPADWTFPLTDAQVDQLLSQDLEEVFVGLDKNVPWWRSLSYERQRVLVNMAFNLGIKGLMGFKNTLASIKSGLYQSAAEGMLASKWASQVSARAKRLAAMMVMG